MTPDVHRRNRAGLDGWRSVLTMVLVARAAAESLSGSLSSDPPGGAGSATNTALQAAVEKLRFPGVTIHVQERCVDVDGTVCLHRGALELVACTKGTKEHESIVAIDAKAMHVHAALLLLGAQPGSPATRQPLGEQGERWFDVPPSGGPVDVFLGVSDSHGQMVEHPIGDFIAPSRRRSRAPDSADKPAKFPTHTFLFAGSVLHGEGPGPRRYLSDDSGNVISLSTFGDELLCLPAIHSQDTEALPWEVDATKLPAVGSKVTLRLRPQRLPAPRGAVANPSPAVSSPEKSPP